MIKIHIIRNDKYQYMKDILLKKYLNETKNIYKFKKIEFKP